MIMLMSYAMSGMTYMDDCEGCVVASTARGKRPKPRLRLLLRLFMDAEDMREDVVVVVAQLQRRFSRGSTRKFRCKESWRM
jgi:hypothetical protein